MKSTQRIRWYVPRWSYSRRLWSQLHHIINPGSLARISLVSGCLTLLIVVGCRIALPGMILPNLWPLVFALPAIVILLASQFALLTVIPPSVTLGNGKIVVHHGQSVRAVDFENMTATYLTAHPLERIRLRICYIRNMKQKVLVVGVSRKTKLYQLSEMLPLEPVIRDARKRGFTSKDHRTMR